MSGLSDAERKELLASVLARHVEPLDLATEFVEAQAAFEAERKAHAQTKDDWETDYNRVLFRANKDARRAEAAEQSRDQLREALGEIVMWCEEGGEPVTVWVSERARAALAQSITTEGTNDVGV